MILGARLRAGIILAGCLICAATAHAQTTAQDNAIRESERVQREQEQRRQEQIARDRQSAAPPSRLEQPDGGTAIPSSDSTKCRDIRTVEVLGSKHLSNSTRDTIAQKYENRCLTIGDIEGLLGDITKAYIGAGYVSARAYLPEQDLSTGILKIQIVEGRLSGIAVHGKPGSVNTQTAFPELVGRPVNLRRIEQGLDQINRLASNRATIDLQPGKEAGDTILIVNNVPTRRIRGNLTFDNLGSRSTGRYQAGLSVSADDLFGLNDFLSMTRRQSSPFNNDENGKSSSETYFGSIPFGPLTLSGGWTDSRYRTRGFTASGKQMILSGDSNSRFVTADFVVKRWRTGQMALSGNVTTHNNNNYLDGERLYVTSRKLTVANLDANIQTSSLGGFATLGIGASFGLTAFGALHDDPARTPDQPRAQFAKYRLSASYFNSAQLGSQRVEFVSSFAAQYSRDPLFGSEQFSIGGLYSVRGFRESTLADDNGMFFRNDIAVPFKLGVAAGGPVTLRPYAGIDVGYVHSKIQSRPDGTLVGAALGASLKFGPVRLDLSAVQRLHAPRDLPKEGTLLIGSLAVKI